MTQQEAVSAIHVGELFSLLRFSDKLLVRSGNQIHVVAIMRAGNLIINALYFRFLYKQVVHDGKHLRYLSSRV